MDIDTRLLFASTGQLRRNLDALASASAENQSALEAMDDRLVRITDEFSTNVSDLYSASSLLEGMIDTEAGDRSAADERLEGVIDAEASTREMADDSLQSYVESEASARETADESLGSRIDALSGTVNTLSDTVAEKASLDALASEAETRAEADSTLADALGTLSGAVAEKASLDALASEAETRAEADSTLADAVAEKASWDALDALTETVETKITMPSAPNPGDILRLDAQCNPYWADLPTEVPDSSQADAGDVLTIVANGEKTWTNILPSGGTAGQVLTKTASGCAWTNAPTTYLSAQAPANLTETDTWLEILS